MTQNFKTGVDEALASRELSGDTVPESRKDTEIPATLAQRPAHRTSQRPVSAIGWGLAFGCGILLWVLILSAVL